MISAPALAAEVRAALPQGATERDLPIGVALAIAEWESGSYDAAFKGGFRTDTVNTSSKAGGLWQIMPTLYSAYGLADAAARFDATKATRGVVPMLVRASQVARGIVPSLAGDDLAGAIYYAHAEGRGAMRSALTMAAARGPVTWRSILAARPPSNGPNGFNFVVSRWPFWQAAATLPGLSAAARRWAGAGVMAALSAAGALLATKMLRW